MDKKVKTGNENTPAQSFVYPSNFRCIVISPKRLVYENDINSIFLTGDNGEYELLAYHYPLLGVLKKSDIIINWSEKISVRGGVVRFFANECTILIEEDIVTAPVE